MSAPVSPAAVSALMRLAEDPELGVSAVAEVVAADAGLAAKVLAVANSASFGLPRQVTQVHQAVAMVGINTTQTLAIAGSSHLLDRSIGLVNARRHAIDVACAARALAGCGRWSSRPSSPADQRLTAESTARSEATTMLSCTPTPQRTRPSLVWVST